MSGNISVTESSIQADPLGAKEFDEVDEDVFILPASFAQRRLWFLTQLEPDSSSYNMAFAYRLTGKLNIAALEQSLNEIVRRHETLRTTFALENGEPVQVVRSDFILSLPIINLQKLPHVEQEITIQRLIAEETHYLFNLAEEPLIRTSLLQIKANEHIFLLTVHHIISDGWSMGIFFRELSLSYRAFCLGEQPALPDLPIQYADFAGWQQEWLQGETLQEQLTYWREKLDGAPSLLELPFDSPRPAVQTFRGAKHLLTLSSDLATSLKALAQKEGDTLFMTMLAGFKIILARYTGQKDIVVGTPIANRNRIEIETLIGFFVNTLVLRTNLSGNLSFRELLARVRETALGAYAHQDLPFEKLVEELRPERNLSYTPLFQIFFNMLNYQEEPLTLEGLTIEEFLHNDPESKFDLTLYVVDDQQQVKLNLVYNADLFRQDRMAELLEQYQQLLRQMVANPDAGIDSVSLLTPHAKKLLPDPARPLSKKSEAAIHYQISQQANDTPDRLAVLDRYGSYTYKEVEIRSNQLANYLLANGIEPQDTVAVYATRSGSLVTALLGILKVGAAFVILDPAYPHARLIDYLKLVKPQGWLQLEAADQLPDEMQEFIKTLSCRCYLKLPEIGSTLENSLLANYSSLATPLQVEPDNLAYLAFTSGTTGQPKAVLGTHRPLAHFLQWYIKTFDLNINDRFSMLSGLAHDPLLRDIFTPLSIGATLCIPDMAEISPGQLANWMIHQQITVAHLTPAMEQFLTSNLNSAHTNSLRYIFFGGDILTKIHLARLKQFAPLARCVNFYGATETPQAMGHFVVPAVVDNNSTWQKIPLGRGIDDVQLLIFNTSQQLAGIGELGEICIRTPYLSNGYLNDDELTRQSFINNPFTQNVEDRIYRTGDLARYLPDGAVEFVGRNDQQVKIRGFRIELNEIRGVLEQHPALTKAVVVARQDYQGDKRLVAYIVGNQELAVPTTGELRDYLKQKLPEYMVPAVFVKLEEVPLTSNGKVDYQSLPAFTENRSEMADTFVAPETDLQAHLAAIWEDVLGIRPIGIQDNFFELGGHSLLAVRLFAQIEDKLGVKLPLATLFQEATIESLARRIDEQSGNQAWSSLLEIQAEGSKPPFFCIHGLTGDILWFRDLAACFVAERPFYGLQARGLDAVQEPFSQVELMATFYIKEMKRVQPAGPYYLGGASFGGTVALEVAHQLLAQGEQVGLLAIFDHAPFNIRGSNNEQTTSTKKLYNVIKIAKNLPRWLKFFLKLKPSEQVGRLQRKVRVMRKNFKGKFSQSGVDIDSIDAVDIIDYADQLPLHRRKLIEAHALALKNYLPKPYSGQVTLFRAQARPLLKTYDPEIGWRKLVSGQQLNVVDVPGSHEGMFKQPYVQTLAQELRTCLDKDQVQSDQIEKT